MRRAQIADVPRQWQRRWGIVGLCFVAFMLCNMDRVNMSIAILPMGRQFGWDQSTVGLVQSSFFWCARPSGSCRACSSTVPAAPGNGSCLPLCSCSSPYIDVCLLPCRGYLLTQIAGGVWADRFGGKRVLAFGVVWWSLATALTPVAANLGLPVLLAARACMGIGEGVAMPAMNTLLSRCSRPHCCAGLPVPLVQVSHPWGLRGPWVHLQRPRPGGPRAQVGAGAGAVPFAVAGVQRHARGLHPGSGPVATPGAEPGLALRVLHLRLPGRGLVPVLAASGGQHAAGRTPAVRRASRSSSWATRSRRRAPAGACSPPLMHSLSACPEAAQVLTQAEEALPAGACGHHPLAPAAEQAGGVGAHRLPLCTQLGDLHPLDVDAQLLPPGAGGSAVGGPAEWAACFALLL